MYHVVGHAVKHANTCYIIFKTCEAHFVSCAFTRVGTQLCAVVFTFSSVTKGTNHGPNGTDVVLCNIEGSCVALYPYNGAHQEFKAAMSAASTSILRVAAIAGTEHVRGITIEHFERLAPNTKVSIHSMVSDFVS